MSEEEEGHLRFLQEGDSSVLSAEGKEEASFIERHPGFCNMADNDGASEEGQEQPNLEKPNQHGRPGSDDDDDSEEEEDEEVDDEAQEAINAAAVIEAETDRLAGIVQAKSLIKLIPKSFQRARSNISPIWKNWFFIPEIIDSTLEPDLKRLDPQAYDMLLDSRKPGIYIFCCKLCYDTTTISLHNCFKKNSSATGPGNLPNHLSTLHKEAYEEYCGKPQSEKKEKNKRSHASDKSDTATPSKRNRQESSQISTSASASKSRKFVTHTSPPLATVATEVSVVSSITDSFYRYDMPNTQCYSSLSQVGTKQLVENFKVLCHDFITFNNIPVRVATSHHDCPEFKKMIMFAMTHGPQIRKQDNLIMGTKQFNNFRKNRFTTLLSAINKIVDEDRSWYRDYLKKEVSFITVGQDVWDSKQKEALGVTAFWYSPTRMKYFIVPLGLEEVIDKKAEPSAEQTLKILALCGISKADIYRAANDTTNVSLMIGRLLTANGEQGTCAMHEIQLVIVHSTGMAQRKKGNKVVDSFPECEELRKKALLASSYLMEKRAKARLKKMHALMTDLGRLHTRIALPNSTRAAGILINWESLIREKWNLVLYWLNNVKAKDLTDDEFYLIAQLSSVLYPIGVLVKTVQSDRPGAISYTLFFTLRTWVVYLTLKKWYVAETRRSEHPEEYSRWDGSYNFPPRTYKGVPIADGAHGKTRKKKYIPMNPVKRDHLHPTAKKLLDRLITEMTNYGVVAKRDRLLAMACNPFMATHGMEELDLLMAFVNDHETYKELISSVTIEHQKTAMEILVQEIKSTCSLIIPNNDDNGGGGSGVVGNDDDAEAEEVDEMEELRRRRANERVESNYDNLDPVESQVHAFFNQQFDPRSGMPLETHQLVGATKFDWIKQWETIVEHFDIFKWWESIGKNSFPLIYPVAIRILSLPDSNGNQERTFSAATWMDGKLNTRQKDMTFQMKVLLYKNQAFLEEHKKDVLEENRKAAAARTKALLKSSMDNMKDSDIDDELEGWMDAFWTDDETAE
jgi:hAT family C-terminal dimerisation region